MSKTIIDFNRIYTSSYDGEYKIIEEVKSNNKKHRKVKIQFIDTGNTQVSLLEKAIKGSVKDHNKHNPDMNKIYYNKSGKPFKIIKEYDERVNCKRMVCIEFINTGTVKKCRLQSALLGSVVDPYEISVCGFGITGENDTGNREYDTWNSMINRCYNPNYASYHMYGAKGVTVCERWRYFDNFKEDIKKLIGHDLWLSNPGKYALDKDRLQLNIPDHMKIYSPETCCFVSISDNAKYVALYLNMHNNTTSKYIGVFAKACGTYEVNLCVNSNEMNFGTYSSEIAAANMYNYVSSYYYPNIDPILLNNVPFMSLDEIQQYRTRKIEMCTIIDKNI